MDNQLDIMRRVKNEETRIWTPQGNVSTDVIRCVKAVEEYDPALVLGRHTMTGDWVIWLKRGPGEDPYPVIGIGKELPSPEALQERLRAADTRIHGDSILSDMRKRNAALEAAESRAADDAAGTAAEALEWAARDIKGYSGRTANVKGRKRDSRKDT